MNANDDLTPLLKKLRLSGVLQTLETRCQQAIDQNLSMSQFLYYLLHDEVERRDGKQLDQRTRRAGFEGERSLEDFDFQFNPSIPRAQLLELGTCAWIQKRQNVLLVGPTGVGKSHLAQALGQRACRAGHTVLFTSAHDMLTQLRAARADQSLERKLLRYTTPTLLIIDDLGLRPLRGDEPMDLYEVIRRRYERGSIIFTSNRHTDEWMPLFGDDLLGSAAMDRLKHHAHIVELTGHSYRDQKLASRKRAR
jgi:DNA replication protein DnaC